MDNLFETWCQEATELIRYRPDREMVTEELMAHMEDAYDTQIRAGLSPEDATQKVLSSMGSADEIAPQLAQIHTPILGYLYSFLKVAAILAAVFAIYLWVGVFGSWLHSLISSRNFDSLPANVSSLDYYCHPNVDAWCDGYHFQITEAGYNQRESTLHLEMEILYLPWMQADTTAHFWAVDSLGNEYASIAEGQFKDIPRIARGSWTSSSCISVHHLEIKQFDCSAQWVELRYDRDGRDVMLHIDLTGGGECE